MKTRTLIIISLVISLFAEIIYEALEGLIHLSL